MATIRVTNQEELLSAMKTASGGDTILLADGDYGTVTLKNDYDSPVTLQAENPGGAVFGKIGLSGATNITLDGLTFEDGLAVENQSSQIEILNVEVDGILYVRNVDDLVIDNVEVSGGQYGILLNNVSNFSVTNSYVHDVTEDLMRVTGDSYNGLIENNVIGDTHATSPTHPDIIQLFGTNTETPHDITIRGNLLYDIGEEGMVPAQGIFATDPGTDEGYYNIIIEDNLINTAAHNTLTVQSGDNSVEISNNTLMSRNGGGGNIKLTGETSEDGGPVVSGNVAKSIDGDYVTSDDNYIYGKTGTNEDINDLLSSTDGSTWESYIPVEGSAIDFGSGYGAQDRLIELLAEAAEAEEADALLSAEAVALPSTVYEHETAVELRGTSGSYVTVEHQESMAIDEGSIALTFNADVTSWKRGLISKDSTGSGDAISAWIENGTLMVRLQDGERTETISYAGIEHNTDYDLLISFDEETVNIWLDDILIGEVAMDVDLSENTDSLVIGGFNGKSSNGTTDNTQYFFDGTISDVRIYDTALSAEELAELEGSDDAVSTETLAEDSTPAASADEAAAEDAEPAATDSETSDAGATSPIVYEHGTSVEVKGTFGSYVTVAHQDSMAIDEGSISLSFNADVTGWKRGLVSKDSTGSGDAISAWIEDGTLIVRFQDGENTATVSYDGIEANKDYDLLISFDEETAKVWLDDTLVGEVAMDVDLSENSDDLLIGAFNGKSSNGTTDNRMYYFDGTISEVTIYDSALTPEELAALDEDNHISTLDSINDVQELALY
jgi:hypothetical protein